MIWTQVAVYIFYHDNHYNTSASVFTSLYMTILNYKKLSQVTCYSLSLLLKRYKPFNLAPCFTPGKTNWRFFSFFACHFPQDPFLFLIFRLYNLRLCKPKSSIPVMVGVCNDTQASLLSSRGAFQRTIRKISCQFSLLDNNATIIPSRSSSFLLSFNIPADVIFTFLIYFHLVITSKTSQSPGKNNANI